MSALTFQDINLSIDKSAPRIQDLRLAQALGFDFPYEIRRLIERHAKTLKSLGKLVLVASTKTPKGGRPGREYWLNERQALYLCAKSETPTATDITIEMVEMFHAVKTGRALPARSATGPGCIMVPEDEGLAGVSALSLKDIRFTIDSNEPHIQDLRLAEILGINRPYDIRELIDRHSNMLESFGELVFRVVHKTRTGRPAKEYWLNEKQALYLCAKSEAPRAAAITIPMAEMFHAVKSRQALPARSAIGLGCIMVPEDEGLAAVSAHPPALVPLTAHQEPCGALDAATLSADHRLALLTAASICSGQSIDMMMAAYRIERLSFSVKAYERVKRQE